MRLSRIIGLVILIFIIENCKNYKEESEHFLKKGTVTLAQPNFSTNNTIINDSTFLTIGPSENGLAIYYTTEGSVPTKQSSLYERPIKISTECVVKARAFSSDWLPSEVSAIEFFNAGIKPDKIELVSELSEKYPGNGIATLIDTEKGTANFSDMRWIGSDDPLSAIVDFGKPKQLNSLKVCFMINTGAWIFPPKSITLAGSNDGINFEEFVSKKLEIPTTNSNAGTVHTSLEFNTIKRYLKVTVENLDKIPEWHDGSGKPSWVFMDEWIFN